MSRRRLVSGVLLGVACAGAVVVGMANAGTAPSPQAEVPAQLVQGSPTIEDLIEQVKRLGPPSGETYPVPPVLGAPVCPGADPGVQNIHVRLGSAPDYFAQGQAQGMTDDQAGAFATQVEAALQAMLQRALATIPLPPCPPPG